MKALGRRPDHCVALGIDGDDGDRSPVSGVPRPAARGSCPRMLVERMTSLQDGSERGVHIRRLARPPCHSSCRLGTSVTEVASQI